MKQTMQLVQELTIAQRAEVAIKTKVEAEAALAGAKADLEALVIENNGEPIIAGDNKVSLSVMPGRVTLSKEKLVAAGVPTDLIALGSTTGAEYQVLNVRRASKADMAKEAA